MARETFDRLARLSPSVALAVLASGQNPDGTPFALDTAAASTRRNVVLGTTGVLLAASAVADVVGTAASPADLGAADELVISSNRTGDSVAIEVGWSRAADLAPDMYETVNVPVGTSVVKRAGSPFVHVRVRNTSAVAALTAHRTSVVVNR